MALARIQGSSSSNVFPLPCSYDVFLSFRGEDTRKNFTDHLYTALVNAGFHTFRDDDELERGQDIKPGLEKAIQLSRSSVIVFSKHYASSKWCLDELVMILEQKRTSDHSVLPVFYGIDPSDVRKQTGSVAKALARHGKKQSPEKLRRWRTALTEVADLTGMVLQNESDGHESKFIKKIVKVIEEKLCRIPLSVDPYLVGIEYWVECINSWLQDGSSDVGILGIYGIGGIGKTTIAQVVYNLSFKKFEASSFLENIRELSEQRPDGLVRIQKQLLYDLTNRREVEINMVAEGINRIKAVIRCKKVLLVLDDVDDSDQLQAIFSMQNCFHQGSKIIITTRRLELLNIYNDAKKLCMETLSTDESLKLFSWYAFGQNHPTDAYMEISRKFVHHIGGLPLALKTLGNSLRGKSVTVWDSELKKLGTIPNTAILKKLRMSYDALPDDHDKNVFLHIACYFIGKEKHVIIEILDGCGFCAVVGLQNLTDRCLVTVEGFSHVVTMHRMIRDMGREIVRLESAKHPEKRSRLWYHEDSVNVLRKKNGSETIEGLALNMHMVIADNASRTSDLEDGLETNAFTSMHRLQLLQLFGVQLTGGYEDFPKDLRWLCWLQFPLHCIPSHFVLENLVVLEMQNSSLRQIWKRTKHLPSLKILDLSHSGELTETGDFSLVPNLERLVLKYCRNLVHVHESIGKLEKLVTLDLENCTRIGKLPKNICILKTLETLILSGCSNLCEFPMELRNMRSLKFLEANEIPINRILTGVHKSWPPIYKHINKFWASFPCSLVELSLRDCKLSVDAFPRDFGNLSSLKKLYLSENPICSLPDCIRRLEGLEYLCFWNCVYLKSLLGLPRVSKELITHGCLSLKRITFQSSSCLPKSISAFQRESSVVEIGYWYKLVPIVFVDEEMITLLSLSHLKSMDPIIMSIPAGRSSNRLLLPIQGLYEYNIFSTFFHGNANEVPGKFTNKIVGSSSSISFTVPNLRIRGLNVFSLYTTSRNYHPQDALITEINNKSKGLKWVYGPSCYGIPTDENDVIWLSHWKLRNQLEAGDEIIVSVHMGTRYSCLEIKEWGFEIVNEAEDHQHITTIDANINEDSILLSGAYEVVPGTYFLRGGPMEWNRRNFNSWCPYEQYAMYREAFQFSNKAEWELSN